MLKSRTGKPSVHFGILQSTDNSNREAMDQLGCKRYCCRRMIMTHVDLIEKLLKYVLRHHNLLRRILPSNVEIYLLQYLTVCNRYNPADRDTKKAAMN